MFPLALGTEQESLPCQEQEAATPLCPEAPCAPIAWPLTPSYPHRLHLLPISAHPGTCKVFPADVGADVDTGIDGIRVLALADGLLLVRQLGWVFLGRKEGKLTGFSHRNGLRLVPGRLWRAH